jgi:hypothetical protein
LLEVLDDALGELLPALSEACSFTIRRRRSRLREIANPIANKSSSRKLP